MTIVVVESTRTHVRKHKFTCVRGDEQYKFKWTDKYRRNLGIRLVNDKLFSSLWDWVITTARRMKMEKIIAQIHLLRI